MTLQDFTKVLAPMWAMAFIVNTALAQQPAVQPTQGQRPEQRQQDMADCQAIAQQSTGYDPAQPPPSTQFGETRRTMKYLLADVVQQSIRAELARIGALRKPVHVPAVI